MVDGYLEIAGQRRLNARESTHLWRVRHNVYDMGRSMR